MYIKIQRLNKESNITESDKYWLSNFQALLLMKPHPLTLEVL